MHANGASTMAAATSATVWAAGHEIRGRRSGYWLSAECEVQCMRRRCRVRRAE